MNGMSVYTSRVVNFHVTDFKFNEDKHAKLFYPSSEKSMSLIPLKKKPFLELKGLPGFVWASTLQDTLILFM